MIIQFSVGNFKSIKHPVTFSMVAARLSSRDKRLDEAHVFKLDEHPALLKSVAIYGANASGKSNIIAAMRFMRRWVLNSSKDTQANEQIPVDRFRLSTEMSEKPSFFEMVFIMDERRYRYGFEITPERVVSEWLYYVPTVREAKLFERTGTTVEVMAAFKEGKDLQERTRENALFLSVVAQFNGDLARKILRWFRNLIIVSGIEDTDLRFITLRMLEKKEHADEILRFVKRLDVGIDDIQMQKMPLAVPSFSDAPKELQGVLKTLVDELQKLSPERQAEEISVLTAHRIFDANGESQAIELFDIDRNESEGTKKLFSIAGPLINALKRGRVLVVDELDARLHPIITKAIIRLFNSNETNARNAQLIFATHDTHLLSRDTFRRDQIWFAEKDRYGATQLYSLAEYKVRNDASFDSDYIRGRYGAIPYIGDLDSLLRITNE